MRRCKHEGCDNVRKAFEYSCTHCKRVYRVARIARELLQEMVGEWHPIPDGIVRVAWELAEELVSRTEDELGY